jgi:hypothetical protein
MNNKMKKLRIDMNKLVESKFDTDSITEMYHKLFVDMAVHGYQAASTLYESREKKLIEALTGILEIGKRDMSNPKYDVYFKNAHEALANHRAESENEGE